MEDGRAQGGYRRSIWMPRLGMVGEQRSPQGRSPLMGLRALPVGIVVEGKDLLNPLRPAAALVEQHLQGLTNPPHSWIRSNLAGIAPSANPIEDGGDVKELRTR